MRDELRKKVGENAKQRQANDAVAGENPRSSAFMLPDAGGRGLFRIRRWDDRGPIFHAKNLPTERSWRKYVMRHACLASRRSRTIWAEFYPGLAPAGQKSDQNHRIMMKIMFHIKKISP